MPTFEHSVGSGVAVRDRFSEACLAWSGEAMGDVFIVTCEHGGNRIPTAYQALFRGQQEILKSHRGYDPGALVMARSLATALNAPLIASTTSRLLIDLNRPAGHPHLFSTVTRNEAPEIRAAIVRKIHHPYWAEVGCFVRQSADHGRRVIHISSHSFTPELDGRLRNTDVGFLYDPARHGEAVLCGRWKATLAGCAPTLRVRRNYPYRGRAAGLTASMRRRFPAETYIGIELEVNQRMVFAGGRYWSELRSLLIRSLLAACTA